MRGELDERASPAGVTPFRKTTLPAAQARSIAPAIRLSFRSRKLW